MAFYTWTSNKDKANHTARITLSPTKDILLGEALDLTAPEVTLLTKLPINLQAGTIATVINSITFGGRATFIRGLNGVAQAVKTTKLK